MSRTADLARRQFLRTAGLTVAAAAVPGAMWRAQAQETITLPFENGERELVKYPQKRPLIRLTSRPPQLETPFSVFNEGVLTPNDAFFVRYHLPGDIPPQIDLAKFRLSVTGRVDRALALSVSELKRDFEPAELVAVNQCSGNSRGFFHPRVAGGQLGNGAMGNARWKGVRLKDVLTRARLEAKAKQVTFDGLDRPIVDATPDFVKALDVDHAMDGEVMIAYAMNGEDLPMLNGYPLRLVVPGYFGTYWIKHLSAITVIEDVFNGFWMNPAYRVPATEGGAIPPGTAPKSTIPITRFNVRSFITSITDGGTLPANRESMIRGIAFDGGHGIAEVLLSADGGRTWRETQLGRDHGRYSFREWTIPFKPGKAGSLELKCRATNRLGQSQPFEPLWNPAGYMRNVVEKVKVNVT